MTKYQSKEGTLQKKIKIGKLVTSLPTNWYPDFSYLIYMYFTLSYVQFVRRQIDAIGRDTAQTVAKYVATPFLL